MSRECSGNVGGYRVWYLDHNGEVAALTRGVTMPADTYVLAVPYDGPEGAPTADEVRSASPPGSVRFQAEDGALVLSGEGAPVAPSQKYPAEPAEVLCTRLQLRNVEGGPAALVAARSAAITAVVDSHEWPERTTWPGTTRTVDPDGLVRHSLLHPEADWLDDDPTTVRLWGELGAAGLGDLQEVFEPKSWYRHARGGDGGPGVDAGDSVLRAHEALVASRLGLSMAVWEDPVVAREVDRVRGLRGYGEDDASRTREPHAPDVTLEGGGTVMVLTSRHTYYNDEGDESSAEYTEGAVLGDDEGVRHLLALELGSQLESSMFAPEGSTSYGAVAVELPAGTVLEAGCVYAVWVPQARYHHWTDEVISLERRLVGVYPTQGAATSAAAALDPPPVLDSVPDDIAGSDWSDEDYGMRGVVCRIEADVEPTVTTNRFGIEVTYQPVWAAVSAIPVEVPAAASGPAGGEPGPAASAP